MTNIGIDSSIAMKDSSPQIKYVPPRTVIEIQSTHNLSHNSGRHCNSVHHTRGEYIKVYRHALVYIQLERATSIFALIT